MFLSLDVSNNKNRIIYSLTLVFIDFQLAKIQIGTKNADKTTKSIEIPSIPSL